MKFQENLQKLRKEAHLSQEALAEKLNVTRQSVSKWESGASYPEMDKLLALCDIFQVELDTLLNKDVDHKEKKEERKTESKNPFLQKIDRAMKKIIYFFSSMKGKDLASFLLTVFLLILVIAFCQIPFFFLLDLLKRFIFSPIGGVVGSTLSNIFTVLFDIFYIIFSLLLFFYVLKLKYFDSIVIKEEKEVEPEKPEITVPNKKKEVIVEKEQTSSFGFSLLTLILKGITLFLLIPLSIWNLFSIVIFGLSLSFLLQGFPLWGIVLCFFAILLLSLLLADFLSRFLFNKKIPAKRFRVSFIIALATLTIGSVSIGLEVSQINFTNGIPENVTEKKDTYTFPMEEDFNTTGVTLSDNYYYFNDIYEVDESLRNEVKVVVSYYDIELLGEVEVTMNNHTLHAYRSKEGASFQLERLLKQLKKDLQKDTIYNYDQLRNVKITISSSSENLKKIEENNKELENAILSNS